MRDRVYADNGEQPPEPFAFTDEVAKVFPDMLARSVPGYATTLRLIRLIAEEVVPPGSRVYDLGCSLGTASLEIADQIGDRATIVAVDSSEPMIRRLNASLKPGSPIESHCADIRDIPIKQASLTLLNFTLQFIPLESRPDLLKRICDGTVPGGALVLSEKLSFADEGTQDRMTFLYESFKKANGYSELEISRKRAALEHVLIPETLDTHLTRLSEAGFDHCEVWFQCFQFVSILARTSSSGA